MSALPRMLVAAACSVCGGDRPLTLGRCDPCTLAPYVTPRWAIHYHDAAGLETVAYVVKDETRDLITRLHPLAVVTDLRVRACSPCGGSCTDACDSGAGSWPEIQEADRRGITVSELRNEEAGQ